MSHPKIKISLRRLKSKRVLDQLFDSGQIIRTRNLLLRYQLIETVPAFYVGVSVSKRNFKKAVDRNRIKRQLREGLREADSQNFFYGNCMLIFTGKKASETMVLKEEISALFNKMKPDSF